MRCINCKEKFTPKVFLQKFCRNESCREAESKWKDSKVFIATHKKSDLKLKPIYKIPKVSEKRKAINKVYEIVRIEVLSEAKFKCFIEGCKNIANTCEHRMGRKGFADEWAKENNIPLLVDKRFLAACCNFHNLELEKNPELSKKYQLSKIHGGIKKQ